VAGQARAATYTHKQTRTQHVTVQACPATAGSSRPTNQQNTLKHTPTHN
jgi:hypothetical protein